MVGRLSSCRLAQRPKLAAPCLSVRREQGASIVLLSLPHAFSWLLRASCQVGTPCAARISREDTSALLPAIMRGIAPLLLAQAWCPGQASSGGRRWSVPLNVAVPSRRDNDKNLKRPWREASFTEGACLCAMNSSTNTHFQSIIGCSVSSQGQDPASRWCGYERGLRNMVPCRFKRGDRVIGIDLEGGTHPGVIVTVWMRLDQNVYRVRFDEMNQRICVIESDLASGG